MPVTAARCLEALGGEAAAILRHLPTNVAALLLRRLDTAQRDRLVSALPPSTAVALRLTLRYPAGTVGAVVDPNVLTVRADMTVAECVRIAREAPEQLRRYLYVLDEAQRLIGVIDARTCLLTKRTTSVRALFGAKPLFLRARGSLVEARDHVAWARFSILPVVGRDGTFLGIVRHRSVLEALGADARGSARPPLTAGLLDLAEFYWRSSADTFLPHANVPRGDR